MKLTALACHEHWADHLAPVWLALDPEIRGAFYTTPRQMDYVRSLGIRPVPYPTRPPFSRDTRTLVASEGDRRRVAPFPVIRFEHGIGASFHGGEPMVRTPGFPNLAIRGASRNPSYAGGENQRNVKMFCNPNHYADDWWKKAYPSIPSVIVGSPKMDRYHNAPPKVRSDPPVVAISFHFDATVVPEARTAFPYYRDMVPEVAKRTDIQLIGHCHPKTRGELVPFYAKHGIRFVPTFSEVMELADVYVIDSMSTLYEFASLDRPVVVLNAPWFRRNIHHGIRFWEHSEIGPVVEHPDELSAAIDLALEDLPEHRERRRLATEELYPYRGVAAERAAEILRRVAYEREGVPAT